MAFIDGNNGENFMTAMGLEPKAEDTIDYLIVHESGSKDYHLYLRSNGRGISDYKLSEKQCLKLYNALKKTLELEKLI